MHSFADNVKVNIPSGYNFPFFPSIYLVPKDWLGESVSNASRLYELLLHAGPLLNITLPLATFLLHRDELRPDPGHCCVAGLVEAIVTTNWAQSPPLQCQLSGRPDILPPSLVPPAMPRAGCQGCASLTPSIGISSQYCSLSSKRLCCLYLFLSSHLSLYLCPNRWSVIPHHWEIIIFSFALGTKALTLKD